MQVYDVGDLVRPGDNEWCAVVSDGWYRGKVGTHQRSESYGTSVAFLGQLHAGDVVVVTGAEWTAATGPIRAADLMDGQIDDHNVVPADWQPVAVADHGYERLTYSPAPPVRAVETLTPRSVRRLDDDHQIVDLGQNINGRVRLRNLGPIGTDVKPRVRRGASTTDGDVTLANLASDDHDRSRQTTRSITWSSAGRAGRRCSSRATRRTASATSRISGPSGSTHLRRDRGHRRAQRPASHRLVPTAATIA